jgi:hypothetical protein
MNCALPESERVVAPGVKFINPLVVLKFGKVPPFALYPGVVLKGCTYIIWLWLVKYEAAEAIDDISVGLNTRFHTCNEYMFMLLEKLPPNDDFPTSVLADIWFINLELYKFELSITPFT